MVAFSFSSAEMLAAGVTPWRGPPHETPQDYALHLWLQMTNADEDMDLETACELASHNGEVYKELWDFGVEKGASLPEAAQAKLFRALVISNPPAKREGVVARRDSYLRAIADALVREYGLKRRRSIYRKPGREGKSAASIISELPYTGSSYQIPGERQVEDIITG